MIRIFREADEPGFVGGYARETTPAMKEQWEQEFKANHPIPAVPTVMEGEKERGRVIPKPEFESKEDEEFAKGEKQR